MQAELREHVSRVSADPMALLRRHVTGTGLPRLTFEYASDFAQGVRIHLIFEMDDNQLILADISSSHDDSASYGK